MLRDNEQPEALLYDQYLQLNLRLQKSLIGDFDIQSATQSALDDWKIDLAREKEVSQLSNCRYNFFKSIVQMIQIYTSKYTLID